MENEKSIFEIAKQNFEKWNGLLQTKNPEEVAKLYTEDSTFLPTMSSDFKFGIEGAKDYFEHFVKKNPFGTIVEEKVQAIRSLSLESYVHSGLYNFEVGEKANREIVQARFTFVWSKINGEWKIIHHHSSVKPK